MSAAATIDAEGLVMGFTFDYVGRKLVSAAASRINAAETSAVAKVSRALVNFNMFSVRLLN